jgi:hypothetical protein
MNAGGYLPLAVTPKMSPHRKQAVKTDEEGKLRARGKKREQEAEDDGEDEGDEAHKRMSTPEEKPRRKRRTPPKPDWRTETDELKRALTRW